MLTCQILQTTQPTPNTNLIRYLLKFEPDTPENHRIVFKKIQNFTHHQNCTHTINALMMYKTMNGLAAEYLQRLFTKCYSNYNLKNFEERWLCQNRELII